MKEPEEGSSLTWDERKRQINKEGWTFDHDDCHINGELNKAALCYEQKPTDRDLPGGGIDLKTAIPNDWPFEDESWKPTPENRQKELVKAGALYRAEIERILRRLENIHSLIDNLRKPNQP